MESWRSLPERSGYGECESQAQDKVGEHRTRKSRVYVLESRQEVWKIEVAARDASGQSEALRLMPLILLSMKQPQHASEAP